MNYTECAACQVVMHRSDKCNRGLFICMKSKRYIMSDLFQDKPGEECGVFGVYDFDGGDVASEIYYGLYSLQHRGQERDRKSVV